MAIDTKTPMALYKANLELVMRLGALLQENRRRWTRFGVASSDDAIERTLDETSRVLTSNDWQSLANLPGETFWRTLQGDVGQIQGALDTAVGNQTAFAHGLQDAFAAWQQQCAEVIQDAGAGVPGNATYEEFLKAFNPGRGAPAAPRKPKAAAPKSRKAAAAKKPAKPALKAKAKTKTTAKTKLKPKAASKAKPKPKAGKARAKRRA